ncbi:MAG TPA: ribosome biogenesis GTP-binding protein YihA/YsxC [Terriglobales bacterium]|jgi:GTP-binding protein
MLNFQASFLKSCGALADLPDGGLPEVALLGRSNVGKSSLLNVLAGQTHLAKTSGTPGRTRLLNYFDVNGQLYLVDCPGYGYAQVARSEREAWGALIQSYLETRRELRLCVLLADAMIPPQRSDLNLHAWLRQRGIPTQLVATKWDRVRSSRTTRALREMQSAFGAAPLPFSSVTGMGRDDLRRILAVPNDVRR